MHGPHACEQSGRLEPVGYCCCCCSSSVNPACCTAGSFDGVGSDELGFRAFGIEAVMSAVNIINVAVLDNPAPFLSPFQFEISYECLAPLNDDLEWKLIYVGSAEDETYDQLLESVLVGPVNVGNYRFVLEADPPDPLKIREEDIIGVTVLLLTCSFLGQEFIRVGYYVNNDYEDEQLREEPPQKVIIDKVQRNILSDKPRVTKFPINFHPENGETEELNASLPNQPTEIDGDGGQPADSEALVSDGQGVQ